MNKHNLFTRFMNYYRKRGFRRTLYRISVQPYQAIFKSKRLLYFAELNEVNDSVLDLPPNISINSMSTYDEIAQPKMKKIINYWKQERELDKAKERLKKGAMFWIVELDQDITGFAWTIKGKLVSPWYLPLTPHDAYFFDAFTFEEYRGQGLYPLLINNILGKLKSDGVSRVVAEVYACNTSSIRGFEKTCLCKFGEARRFYFLNRNITIWSQ